jgi:hypothetical protein
MPIHRQTLRFLISAAGALSLVACSKGDPAPAGTTTATSTTTSTAHAVTAVPPAAPTTAKTPASGKLPDLMTADQAIDHFKTDKASMMSQHVKIKGYYTSYTKQGDQLNVEVTPQAEITSKGPLCIFPASAKAALDKVKAKTTITVSGTVDGDFFGRPKLTGCKLE